jgi:hypothetical protein
LLFRENAPFDQGALETGIVDRLGHGGEPFGIEGLNC